VYGAKKVMIRSMTGFGRAVVTENDRKFTVELKSVNHRYLDMSVRLPKKFAIYDSEVRNVVKEYAIRGKVEISVSYEDLSKSDTDLVYNEKLAEEYFNYGKMIAEKFSLRNDIAVSTIMRSPDVLTMTDSDSDEEELVEVLKKTVALACKQLVETRSAEGENLLKDFLEKLDFMQETVENIAKRSPASIAEYRAKIEEKVRELLANTDIDNNRIAAEVTMYADKVCVDEELVRLKSHINTMRNELKKGGELGKRLDFVTQEMNRESNTILSKCSDIAISNYGIDLKTTIEKIREQVQNVE